MRNQNTNNTLNTFKHLLTKYGIDESSILYGISRTNNDDFVVVDTTTDNIYTMDTFALCNDDLIIKMQELIIQMTLDHVTTEFYKV